MRRVNHPLRVAYELILDHKNAKIRIDGASLSAKFFCVFEEPMV